MRAEGAGPHSFWARLTAAERVAVARIGTRRTFAAKSVVCREGEESRHVLVLLKGNAKVTAFGADGREITMAVRGPGDVIGELAAIDSRPRSATVLALDDVDALAIPGDRFAALCQEQGRIGWALLGVVTERLRDSGRQWADFGGGTSTRRIVALLLDLAARDGRPGPDGIEIVTRAPQHELAATVGTSRESMARALHDLRARGLVTTSRGRIVIHDIAGLRALSP